MSVAWALVAGVLCGGGIALFGDVEGARDAPSGWRVLSEGRDLGEADRDCLLQATIDAREHWRVTTTNGLLSIIEVPDGELVVAEAVRAATGLDVPANAISSVRAWHGGELVGVNMGEWGGGLWWFDAKGSRRELSKWNVREVCIDEDRALVLGGIAHLRLDHGRIDEVRWESGQLELRSLGSLAAAPLATTCIGGGQLVFVSSNGVWKRNRDGRTVHLVQANYQQLGVKSVAMMENGDVYVGMRAVVARALLAENGYRHQWLVPNNCAVVTLRDHCECIGAEGP